VSHASQTPGGAEALDALYWQAEILQALYWMQGEGLASDITPGRLADFLVADQATVADQLERLAHDGYLEVLDGPRYRLSELGRVEGGRSFHDEFADFIRPAHAECGPGCWCQDPKHAGEPCPGAPDPTPAPAPEPRPEAPRVR
jgi:hypothetical protein